MSKITPTSAALVRAGAGAGKTQMLAERLSALLRAGVPPAQVVAITYTRAAAQELRDRIIGLLNASEQHLVDKAHIGTIDAVLPRLVAEKRKLAFGPELTVLQHQAVNRALGRLPDSERNWLLSLFPSVNSKGGPTAMLRKRVIADADRLRARRAPDWSGPSLSANGRRYAEMLWSYQREFDRLKADGGVVDQFDVMNAALNSSAEYAYVFLDEAQDVDALQLAALQHLARNGVFLAVADLAQSIFGFRNADPECLLELRKTETTMEENKRCGKAIVAFANGLPIDDRIDQEKTRKHVGEVRTYIVKGDEKTGQEDMALLTAVLVRKEQVQHSLLSPRTIAVICRQNRQCRDVVQALRQLQRVVCWNAAASMTETDAVTALVDYLRGLAGLDVDEVSTATVLHKLAGLSETEADGCAAAGTFAAAIDCVGQQQLNPVFVERHDRLMNTMQKAAPLRDRLRAVLAQHHYFARLEQDDPSGIDADCVRALLAAVEAEDDLKVAQLHTYLKDLSWTGRDTDLEWVHGQPLVVLTVHQAKGLDFDSVYVPFVNTFAAPWKDDQRVRVDGSPGVVEIGIRGDAAHKVLAAQARKNAEAEARRLFYVVATRAKDRLTLVLTHPAMAFPAELDFVHAAFSAVHREHPKAVLYTRTTRNSEPEENNYICPPPTVIRGPVPVARPLIPTLVSFTSLKTAAAPAPRLPGPHANASAGTARDHGLAVHALVGKSLLAADLTAGWQHERDPVRRSCLKRAATSPVYHDLCTAAARHVEDRFHMRGRLTGSIDAWAPVGNGHALIADWKTGRDDLAHHLQRVVYALALLHQFYAVRVATVNLGSHRWPDQEERWTRADIQALEDELR